MWFGNKMVTDKEEKKLKCKIKDLKDGCEKIKDS